MLKSTDAANKGLEIHVISSSSKPFTAWITRDGIQVCREACGGHGYLQGIFDSFSILFLHSLIDNTFD